MPRSAARLFLVLGSSFLVVVVLALVEWILVALDVAPQAPSSAVHLGGAIKTPEDVVVWDRELLYRYAPNCEFLGFYRTNSLGYRGAEFPETKARDTLRIAFVGDSCTFGLGQREEETVARRLEVTLERAFAGSPRFEVLNFGVVGYSTYQSTRQIEIDLARFAPDIVVYTPTAFNDATYAPDSSDEARARDHQSVTSWLLQRRLVRLVGLARDRYELPERIELAKDKDPGACRVPIADLDRLVSRAVAAVREMGAAPVVAVSTIDANLRDQDPTLKQRLEILERVARSHDVVVVPVGAAIEAYEPLSLFQDGVHPNPIGVTAIVRTLFDALVMSDVLPAIPRREFLRALVVQSKRGCYSKPQLEDAAFAGAPPEFLGLLARASGAADVAADVAADSAVGEIFERFDPIVGESRSRYGVARAVVLEGRGSSDPDVVSSPAARDAFVAEVEINVWPRDALARYLWGELAVGGLPSPEALARARAATAYASWLGIVESPRDRRLGIAARALAAGDSPTFFEAIERVVALNPKDAEGRVLRARVRRALGKSELAVAEIEEVLSFAPDDAGALGLAALLALEAKDVARAKPLLERAVAANPFAIECRYGLARLLLESGDRAAARRELYVVLAIDREAFPDAYVLWQSLESDP